MQRYGAITNFDELTSCTVSRVLELIISVEKCFEVSRCLMTLDVLVFLLAPVGQVETSCSKKSV